MGKTQKVFSKFDNEELHCVKTEISRRKAKMLWLNFDVQ